MSLTSIAQRIASIKDPSIVSFLPERCLHTLDQGAACTACFDLCPAGAITAGSPPVFEEQNCRGCLACLPVCPTGAYSAGDAVPNLLIHAGQLETPQVELLCQLHPKPHQGLPEQATGLVVRGCLAGLGAGAGMALAVSGFDRIIYRCDACAECPWGTLQTLIETQVKEVQQLLAPWGKAAVPVVCDTLSDPANRPLVETEKPPVSRRDVFRLVSKQAKLAAARAIVKDDTTQPRQPGRDRLRKLRAAFELGEPSASQAVLPKSDFVQLYVNESCTACGTCVRVCPTQAIQLVMDIEKQRFRLVFYPQSCIDCGLCIRYCSPDALEAGGVPQFKHLFQTKKPVMLQAGDLKRCERCNTPFAAQPDEYLCPMCQFRAANPFGSQFLPGFKVPLDKQKDNGK